MLKDLLSLPPEMLVLVAAVVLGYGLRRSKAVRNGWIFPGTMLLATIAYTVLGMADQVAGKTASWNVTHCMIIGVVLGVVGALGAVALHNKAFAAMAAKWPALSWLVCDDEQTRQYTRKDFGLPPSNPPAATPPAQPTGDKQV